MPDRVCSNCLASLSGDPDACPHCGHPSDRTVEISRPPRADVPTSDEPELGPGSVFAKRYTIIERIGAGGMGVVYKAIDRTLDTDVALKLIRTEVAENPGLVERFKREARVTRRMAHPCVCRVHDIGEHDDVLFLSMEWIEGDTLAHLIRQAGKLSERRALTISERIARGLEIAHAKGVVHRDLKPSNVMIDVRGQVRVLDFGLAQEQGSNEISRTGAVVGTPFYMAPEQRHGGEVDSRSDLYALGLILREMLTGMRLDQEAEVPDPVDLGVNPAIASVIRKLLAENPDDRYANATEVRSALHEILEDQSFATISTPDGKPVSEPSRPSRRVNWAVGAVTLVAIAVVVSMVLKLIPPDDGLDSEARFHFDRAVQHLHEEGESPRALSDAIASLHRARRHAPESAIVLARLGEAYWTRYFMTSVEDAREEAEVYVASACELDPDLPEALYARGLGSNAIGDYEAAIGDLERAVEEKPELFEAWVQLGVAHQQLGSYAASREAFEKAIQLQPDRGSLRVYLGVLHEDLGEHDEAIRLYREAIALSPDNIMAVNNLGTACLMTERYDEAVEVYRRAIELEETGTAVSNLGTSYYLSGDYESAIEQYRRASVLEPEKAVHWGNMGDSWLAMEDDVRAREAYERAADLAELRIADTPDDPHAVVQLALYCAKARREPCAIANGARASDLQPDNPRFLRINAAIHAKFGRIRDSLDYLEQAVKFGCTKVEIDTTPELELLRTHPRFEDIYASAD